jgi:sec-independent protein translocase protein TatA
MGSIRSRPAASGARYHGAMLGNIGPLEIIVVLIIALVVFGPKRLPELGRSLGRGIREFRGSVSGERDDEDEDERRASPHEIEVGRGEASTPEEPLAHKRP